MIRNRLHIKLALLLMAAMVGLLALPACSINVKKSSNGEDKKVDIDTPVGGIHVDKDADVRDTGLPVYPGSRPAEKQDDDENKANVNLSFGVFGVKVIAVGYDSDDAPDKIVAFYRDQLKKYGTVLECHVSHQEGVSMDYHSDDDKNSDKDSQKLTCDRNDVGKNIELKVGTRDNQHIVSVEPRDKGTKFKLVLVQLRGKETI